MAIWKIKEENQWLTDSMCFFMYALVFGFFFLSTCTWIYIHTYLRCNQKCFQGYAKVSTCIKLCVFPSYHIPFKVAYCLSVSAPRAEVHSKSGNTDGCIRWQREKKKKWDSSKTECTHMWKKFWFCCSIFQVEKSTLFVPTYRTVKCFFIYSYWCIR